MGIIYHFCKMINIARDALPLSKQSKVFALFSDVTKSQWDVG